MLAISILMGISGIMSPHTWAQNLFPTEIIYDTAEGEFGGRHSSSEEYGDEIVFGGTFRDLIIFQFEYFGEFIPDGDETCTVRFYLNDGEGEPGFEKPSTMIYESETFPIFPDFNTVSITDINIEVPNRITWTVDFDGVSGLANDRAGLLFRNPPEVGESFDDIWKRRRSGLWVATRFSGDPLANFAARFISSVDLSVNVVEARFAENGATIIRIQGPPGQRILVEMSHDLKRWSPVFLGDLGARLLDLVDAREDLPFPRFFRASITQQKDVTLTGPNFLENGTVELIAAGPNGLPFILQSTTDLETWEDVAQFTFSTRDVRIVDDQIAETGPKIYRIIVADVIEEPQAPAAEGGE